MIRLFPGGYITSPGDNLATIRRPLESALDISILHDIMRAFEPLLHPIQWFFPLDDFFAKQLDRLFDGLIHDRLVRGGHVL